METTPFETLTRTRTDRHERTTTRRSLVTLIVGGLLAASMATAPETEARRRGGWGRGHRNPRRPCWGHRRPCLGRPPGPPRNGGVSAPPLVLPPLLPPAPTCIATGEVCPATCAPGGECAACCGGICTANGSCGTPA